MKIYIANFDTRWTDEDLKTFFLPYGTVQSAQVMMDGFTEKSRGFGYVEMPDENEAETAIKALHDTDQDGRKLTVTKADPKVERKGSYKVGSGGVNPYRFRKN